MPANAEPIPDGPNTFSKPQESASSGNPGTSVSGGDGRPGDGRQRAGVKSRSTDPHAKSEPSHGDNPEARRQMAASSGNSARTTMQKRDSARRRWGGTNTGQIGFERKVHVAVTANRIFIGENDIEVVIEPGTKPEELLEAVLSALDEHSRAWGKPPNRFYWVPYISFDVYSGASSQHERLNGPLREWGIFSEAKFKEGDKPPALKTEQTENPILLASKQAPNNATPSKTPRKLIGPKEAVANKPAGDKVPTAEKSRFSWFKNSWFKKISN